MSESFSRSLARVVAAQCAEAEGYESIQDAACEALAEILLRYISEAGTASHSYAELAGRTECNVNDVLLAFQDMGVSIPDLINYSKKEEELPFARALPKYPIKKKPRLLPTFKEKEEECEAHIPEFFPAFPDKHTYVKTPTFDTHPTDARAIRLEKHKQKREAEMSLVSLTQRTEPDRPFNYMPEEEWADKGKCGAQGGGETGGSARWEDTAPSAQAADRTKDAEQPGGTGGGAGAAAGVVASSIAEEGGGWGGLQSEEEAVKGAAGAEAAKSKGATQPLRMQWSSRVRATALASAGGCKLPHGAFVTDAAGDVEARGKKGRAERILSLPVTTETADDEPEEE